MEKEIKKIREYIACPQFGDEHYGKWGALKLEQRIKIKQLLDYITNLQQINNNQAKRNSRQRLANQKQQDLILNLQQENERLKKNQRLSPEERQHFHLDIDEIYEILIDYKSRCEKAVKYIDTNFCIENRRDLKEVVNILQNGSDSQ